jgi:hypothetical protein
VAVQLVDFEYLEEDLRGERHRRARQVLEYEQLAVLQQVQVHFFEVSKIETKLEHFKTAVGWFCIS